MSRFLYHICIIPLCLLLLSECTQHSEILEQPDPVDAEVPPYARHLKGFKICLDPGHGGQGHIPDYKRGPTGTREANINLQVALHLQEMLQEAGVTVLMTRVDDSYVSLPMRSQIANENRADFFISLHHNGSDNPKTNYTSTWYHGDADDSRPSLDLARYIQQGVSDALRLPTSAATGLYSDKLITTSGFGVLRLTKCPAVLCEASFYSNPEEEARLKQEAYRKREAYGYFLGIARYVASGFPKGVLLKPQHESVIQTKMPSLQIRVMDGLHERGAWMLKRQQIFTNPIQVKIDNVSVPYHYDRAQDLITVDIKKPLSNGIHFVQTELVNYYGNHSLPSPQWFKVAPPAAELKLNAWTDTLPFDGRSYVGITVTAQDADGMPIADGEPIHAKTSNGTLADTLQRSKDGTSRFYLYAPAEAGTATVAATYGETRGSLTIHFADIANGIVQGQVSDANSQKPIQNVQLHVNSGLTAVTDAEGHFFITAPMWEGFVSPTQNKTTLHISKTGYYPDKRQIHVETNKATIINAKLHAIADGAFAQAVLILDSKTDTRATQQLIKTLKEMLELAGAKVYNLYTPGQKTSAEKRIAKVNAIEDEGYYLQINHAPWREEEPAVIATHYRGNQGTETFLKCILEQFKQTLFDTPIVTIQDTTTPEIQHTNKKAMVLEIRSLNYPNTSAAQEAYAIFLGAWAFLKADSQIAAQTSDEIYPVISDLTCFSTSPQGKAKEIDAEKLNRFMLYLKKAQGE